MHLPKHPLAAAGFINVDGLLPRTAKILRRLGIHVSDVRRYTARNLRMQNYFGEKTLAELTRASSPRDTSARSVIGPSRSPGRLPRRRDKRSGHDRRSTTSRRIQWKMPRKMSFRIFESRTSLPRTNRRLRESATREWRSPRAALKPQEVWRAVTVDGSDHVPISQSGFRLGPRHCARGRVHA